MGAFFSIITVSKNNLAGLRSTAASVEKQTCRDFEWIVVDGGTGGALNTETASFLEGTEALWTSAPDHGIYDAMNKGIERASGDYLLFLNAGDRLVDNDVLNGLKNTILAQKTVPDFVYGDAHEEEKSKLFHKPARKAHSKSCHMFTHHQAMLYRRAAHNDLRYNANYKIAADYDFTMRFLQRATILQTGRSICVFEAGGASQQNTQLGRDEQFKIRKNLEICAPLTNHYIRSKQMAAQGFRNIAPALYWRLRAIMR